METLFENVYVSDKKMMREFFRNLRVELRSRPKWKPGGRDHPASGNS